MPLPTPPTPDVAISALDPKYIPFTTADPDGSEITVDDFPQKEPVQYRRIIEYLRAKLLAGDVLTDEAFAFLQTENNDVEADSWTITSPGVPTGLVVTGGVKLFATCFWVAPSDQGTAGTISNYQIEYSIDSFTTITIAEKVIGTAVSFPNLPVSVAGTYDIRVRTINQKGVSAISNVVTGIVVT